MPLLDDQLEVSRRNAEEAVEKVSQIPELADEAEIMREQLAELHERHELLKKYRTKYIVKTCRCSISGPPKCQATRFSIDPECTFVQEDDDTVACVFLKPDNVTPDDPVSFKVHADTAVKDFGDAAETLYKRSMKIIESQLDELTEFGVRHFAGHHARLYAQRARYNHLCETNSSEPRQEIAVAFFFSDATKFYGMARLLKDDLDDEPAAEPSEKPAEEQVEVPEKPALKPTMESIEESAEESVEEPAEKVAADEPAEEVAEKPAADEAADEPTP